MKRTLTKTCCWASRAVSFAVIAAAATADAVGMADGGTEGAKAVSGGVIACQGWEHTSLYYVNCQANRILIKGWHFFHVVSTMLMFIVDNSVPLQVYWSALAASKIHKISLLFFQGSCRFSMGVWMNAYLFHMGKSNDCSGTFVRADTV